MMPLLLNRSELIEDFYIRVTDEIELTKHKDFPNTIISKINPDDFYMAVRNNLGEMLWRSNEISSKFNAIRVLDALDYNPFSIDPSFDRLPRTYREAGYMALFSMIERWNIRQLSDDYLNGEE